MIFFEPQLPEQLQDRQDWSRRSQAGAESASQQRRGSQDGADEEGSAAWFMNGKSTTALTLDTSADAADPDQASARGSGKPRKPSKANEPPDGPKHHPSCEGLEDCNCDQD